MNLPLNIDIQQILLHMFNLVILVGGLYLILYKPVKKFMDQRTAYYQKLEDDAKAKLADAEAAKEACEAKLSGIDAEMDVKRAEASKKIDEETAKAISEARKEADKILADARKAAKIEHDEIVASAQKDIAELATEAADKLVERSLDNLYTEFLEAASGNGGAANGR